MNGKDIWPSALPLRVPLDLYGGHCFAFKPFARVNIKSIFYIEAQRSFV